MITIYAEKPDVGNKIAAALDCITLNSGRKITFDKLKDNEKAVKSQQFKDGYLKIKYKGEDTYVTWGYGHLCELKQAQDYDEDYKKWQNIPMPFIPPSYDIKVKDDTKKQFKLVKDLFTKSNLIINATDPDREGEVIFAYLLEATKLKKPFKRVHFTSQTEEGIRDAFDNLKNPAEVEPMTNAGKGRSIADWVIGSNLTVAMSLKYNSGVLSIGRVQTPTLNMLVERELAIRNFKSEKYYTIEGHFTTKNGEEYIGDHTTKKFNTKTDAEKIVNKIKGKPGIVEKIEKKMTKKDAPTLYSLSSLQMAANSQFGFTLEKTLNIAQELYEGGFTTYPRTDSQYLTEDMEPVVNKTLDMLEKIPEYTNFISGKPRKYNRKKYFDDSKVTSHFAIIPTRNTPKGLTPDQEKIYDLIARSVIMMLYGPAEIERTSVTTDVDGEKFVTNGSTIVKKSWMEVGKTSKEKFLPVLAENETVTGTYKFLEKNTEPPKSYTDNSLLSAMISAGKDLDDEELKKVMDSGVKGIGTEATRAAIIETLIKRGYAIREKKSIKATDKGISLIQALPLKEIKSAELTAMWENRLNNIALEKEDFDTFVTDIEELTRRWTNEITTSATGVINNNTSSASFTCPICKKPVVKRSWGWGCSGYKEGCKFSIGEIAGKKLSDKAVSDLFEKGKTGTIKGFKGKTGKIFDAKLTFDENYKVVFDFGDKEADEDLKCPICGHPLNKTPKGWGCSDYKNGCPFVIWEMMAGKKLSEANVKALLKNKKTGVIKGFKGKTGKTFDAPLMLTDDYQVTFKFDEPKLNDSLICPECGLPLVQQSWGWGCSGYREGCKFSIRGEIAGKKLSEKHVRDLLEKSATDLIKGFTSSAGKKFDAYLILTPNNEVKFDFPKNNKK